MPEIRTLDDAIGEVRNQFRTHPNIFLNEEDLRVHLCSQLLQIYGRLELTSDGQYSIALHSEVRWYGDGDLKIRSDIVVVEVQDLEVLRHKLLPSKGYGFNIPTAIIELKFRRPNGPTDHRFFDSIQKDLNKLETLHELFSREEGGRLPRLAIIVFDKKNRMPELPLTEIDDVELIYEFGNRSEQRRPEYRSQARGL